MSIFSTCLLSSGSLSSGEGIVSADQNNLYGKETVSYTHLCRGDIYCAKLDPVVGSEQGGIRPVIVIPVSYTHLDVYKRQP